jgi:hypothetical protein
MLFYIAIGSDRNALGLKKRGSKSLPHLRDYLKSLFFKMRVEGKGGPDS